MKFKFLSYFVNFLIFSFLIACSNEKLVNMGVIKTKTNQFSVSRKSPLEMPPDMYLRPPKLEEKENNSNLNSAEKSLDDILADTKISENKDKNILKEKRILKKILNADAKNLK